MTKTKTRKRVVRTIADRLRVQTFPTEKHKSKVQQQFRDATNANSIMAKYRQMQFVPKANQVHQFYGNVTEVDYKQAMDIMANAQSTFELIPAETRAQFDNSVNNFLAYARNPENYDQMKELGLIPLDESGKPLLRDSYLEAAAPAAATGPVPPLDVTGPIDTKLGGEPNATQSNDPQKE